MAYELSDDEFCETNFAEPSPVKKRSTFLTNPKELKEKLRKTVLLQSKMKQTETELLTYLEQKLKSSQVATENLTKNTMYLSLIEADPNKEILVDLKLHQKEILFNPAGRLFFRGDPNGSEPDPSSWFSSDSSFHFMTHENLLAYLKQGLMTETKKWNGGTSGAVATCTNYYLKQKIFEKPKNMKDEDAQTLWLYWLQTLKYEEDPLTTSLILQWMASIPVPFHIISLRDWGSPQFSKLLQILENLVPGYSVTEVRTLFREACLAALDEKTFNFTHVFPSFLSTCLQVFSNELSVSEEIRWLLGQNLKPEEKFHLLKILPQCGTYDHFGLQFGFAGLQTMMTPATYSDECSDLINLAEFLKKHELEIRSLSLNAVFHYLNILNYIIFRLSDHNQDALEDILCCIEGLKHHSKTGVSYSVINEAINRMVLTLQQRIPSHLCKKSAELQYKRKLFLNTTSCLE